MNEICTGRNGFLTRAATAGLAVPENVPIDVGDHGRNTACMNTGQGPVDGLPTRDMLMLRQAATAIVPLMATKTRSTVASHADTNPNCRNQFGRCVILSGRQSDVGHHDRSEVRMNCPGQRSVPLRASTHHGGSTRCGLNTSLHSNSKPHSVQIPPNGHVSVQRLVSPRWSYPQRGQRMAFVARAIPASVCVTNCSVSRATSRPRINGSRRASPGEMTESLRPTS